MSNSQQPDVPVVANDVAAGQIGDIVQAGSITGGVHFTVAVPHPSAWRRFLSGGAGNARVPPTSAGMSTVAPLGRLPQEIRGRSKLLKTLSKSVDASTDEVHVLAGMGGVGKSTIALALAGFLSRRSRLRPARSTWWVSAADRGSFLGGMVSVARALGAGQSDLDAIGSGAPDGADRLWSLLDAAPRRWLLIIDNADDDTILARRW
jgi:hypothetical protein